MATQSRVVALEPDDAWSLLPRSGVGRLLYTKSALPAVRLLPFVLCDHTMVLALDSTSRDQLPHVLRRGRSRPALQDPRLRRRNPDVQGRFRRSHARGRPAPPPRR
jgi:hypothetical protein